jgi:hypothetical protein
MIIFLLIISLVISLGLNIATCILIQILLKKTNIYEQWVNEFKQNIADTLEKMKKLDADATFKSSFESNGKGVFESDDQVGEVFKELLDLIEKLNEKIQ